MMQIKLSCLYLIIQNICILNTIFVDNIVRFTCNNCSEAETCCMGTLIQPNIVLSTSFCANFCHVSKRGKIVPIVKIYSYPHYKKYLSHKDTKDYSNFALALFEPTLSERYVTISAVEPLTTIGLKIFIPIVAEQKLRLQSTVIQRCENAYTQSNGLHVCTGKVISDLKSCQKVQGAPLLLTDRLLGMSIIHDCRLMQRVFIAVAPFLFWIRSTIEHIERNNQKQLVLRIAVPVNAGVKSTEITTKSANESSTPSTMTTLGVDVTQVEQPTKTANMNTNITTILDDETKNETRSLKSALTRSQDVTDLVTTSTGLSSSLKSSISISDFSMPLLNRSSFPKVMEWFKEKKNRLNKNPQAFLVLTRPPVRQETGTEFMDLT